MMLCRGTCEYFHVWKNFAPNRTYETHKQCTICSHVVDKEEFPDLHCYCCAALYRVRFRQSRETRQLANQRKQERKNLDDLNLIMVNGIK